MARGTKQPQVPWQFTRRFRAGAFGWRSSSAAIGRIREALAEIREAARHDLVRAAEGAVLFLEKLSPAIRNVDSSSGALGSAAHEVVSVLSPLIAKAPIPHATRVKWLERLFEAIQNDDPPYLESLHEQWGELCASPELAAHWADELVSLVRHTIEDRKRGVFAYFSGTGACYAAMFAAGRHDDLFALVDSSPRPIFQDLRWAGKVLVARGEVDRAIAYLGAKAGLNNPVGAIARFAEAALIEAGRREEAYERYAIEANQAGTRIATFRARS